jgi:hypothetical protein
MLSAHHHNLIILLLFVLFANIIDKLKHWNIGAISPLIILIVSSTLKTIEGHTDLQYHPKHILKLASLRVQLIALLPNHPFNTSLNTMVQYDSVHRLITKASSLYSQSKAS